ncbi:MAG: hypothetical protein AAB874_04520 [Patescibacteria group bacterium]
MTFKALLSNNLKAGFLLSLVAVILMFVKGFVLVAAIIGVFGFIKSKRAIQEGKLLGIVGGFLSILPLLYLLVVLFVLGYTLTSN